MTKIPKGIFIEGDRTNRSGPRVYPIPEPQEEIDDQIFTKRAKIKEPKGGRVTWGADEFDPEFHCFCEKCNHPGHIDSDGWEYDPKTGVMLCIQCAEED